MYEDSFVKIALCRFRGIFITVWHCRAKKCRYAHRYR